MRKLITAATLASSFVVVLAAGQNAGQPQNPPAQTPRAPQQPTPSTSSQPSTPSVTGQQPTMTLAGCLYREEQVPGRKPNPAERVGIAEDFILADASIATAEKPGATPGATGTAGAAPSSGNMYRVDGQAADKLKPLVGKRVEVTGRIDIGSSLSGAAARPAPDQNKDLPEFEATSIREVPGTCPATPAPRK
jgi:hypothetical protein